MKIYLVSLGCDKNLVDSEFMLGYVANGGHVIVNTPEEAEIIIVNTCSFINDAKKESIDTIIELGKLKEDNLKYLIVAGCLGQRYKNDVMEQLPEVDAIVGTTAVDKICECIDELINGNNDEKPDFVCDSGRTYETDIMRMTGIMGGYSYLKIAEGCDKHCTYCAIPLLRGNYRSIPIENLLKQANKMVNDGVAEIILVAQETTLYGIDLYGKKSLPRLLEKLSEIEDLKRIRVLYCYPEEIDDELIECIKNSPKVCHYLDIPMQHASDKILKLMGRKARKDKLLELISKLRREIPDIAIRTTFITGFPGETYKDYLELKSFIKIAKLDRVGIFTYSREEDTPAYKMKHQVFEFVKKLRKNSLMKIQKEISFAKNSEKIGKVYKVLVTGTVGEDENKALVCRTYMDTPDVDGVVFVSNPIKEYLSGEEISVRITKVDEYDLEGEIVYESAE